MEERITERFLDEEASLSYPPEDILLILYFPVKVKTLFELGKDYPWIKPQRCPQCKGRRLWGHGFVTRCFNRFSEKLWIKRYRCPDCSSVHTMRPSTHWSRFQYSISVILGYLLKKIRDDRWRLSMEYIRLGSRLHI